MRQFVVILVAVAVTAAAVTTDRGSVAPTPLAKDQLADVADVRKVYSVYGTPTAARDIRLMQEKSSVRGLFEKPFFAAVKAEGKDEMYTFLLKDGLGSLSTMMTTPLLRDDSAPVSERVGIMLSAARFLDLPEMKMPIVKLTLPQNFTLDDVFSMSQDHPLLPWMYLAKRSDLAPGALEKLFEVGQFSVAKDKFQVTRDFSQTTRPTDLTASLELGRDAAALAHVYAQQSQQLAREAAIMARISDEYQKLSLEDGVHEMRVKLTPPQTP